MRHPLVLVRSLDSWQGHHRSDQTVRKRHQFSLQAKDLPPAFHRIQAVDRDRSQARLAVVQVLDSELPAVDSAPRALGRGSSAVARLVLE